MPYIVSTGSTDVRIGAVLSLGNELLYSWRDSTDEGYIFGLDSVYKGSGIYSPSGTWRSRIFDNGDPDAFMQAVKVEIIFEELDEDETVTPIYRLDRALNGITGYPEYTTGTAATEGDKRIVLYINQLCKEAEWGFNFTSPQLTRIVITGVNFYYDDLADEESSI